MSKKMLVLIIVVMVLSVLMSACNNDGNGHITAVKQGTTLVDQGKAAGNAVKNLVETMCDIEGLDGSKPANCP